MTYFSNKPYYCLISLKRNHSLSFSNPSNKKKRLTEITSILRTNHDTNNKKIIISNALFSNSMMIIGEESNQLFNPILYPRIIEQHVKSYFSLLDKNEEIILEMFKKMLIKYMKHLNSNNFIIQIIQNERMIID